LLAFIILGDENRLFMFISSYFERFGTDLKVRLAPLIFFSCISITVIEIAVIKMVIYLRI